MLTLRPVPIELRPCSHRLQHKHVRLPALVHHPELSPGVGTQAHNEIGAVVVPVHVHLGSVVAVEPESNNLNNLKV